MQTNITLNSVYDREHSLFLLQNLKVVDNYDSCDIGHTRMKYNFIVMKTDNQNIVRYFSSGVHKSLSRLFLPL